MYILLVALCCGNQGSKKVPSGTSRFSCREVRFHSHLPNRALRQVVRHISKKIKLPKADKIWELLFQKPRGIFMRVFLALETLDLYGTLETNATLPLTIVLLSRFTCFSDLYTIYYRSRVNKFNWTNARRVLKNIQFGSQYQGSKKVPSSDPGQVDSPSRQILSHRQAIC